jgi:hypothetical protein
MRWFPAAVATGVLMQLALAVPVAAQRRIVQDDTPLPDRLLPTDQLVVIVSPAQFSEDRDWVDFAPLTVNTAISVAVSLHRAMFVAICEQTTARLAEHDTWITTLNTVRVVGAIKATEDDTPGIGDIVDVVQDGGELTIKGVRVRTYNLPTQLFVPGRRYLVFTGEIESDRTIRICTVYEVLANGRLAWQDSEKRREDWRRMLSGRSLKDVEHRLRAMDELMKRYPDRH